MNLQMITEMPDAAQAQPAETRFEREARVAKDFGRILHDISMALLADVGRSEIPSTQKDEIRQAFVRLIDETLDLDPHLDVYDLQNLLYRGRL